MHIGIQIAVVACTALSVAVGQMRVPCTVGADRFIADEDNLCIYYECVLGKNYKRDCPKGTRVPTYFESSQFAACTINKLATGSDTCLRCDTPLDTPVIIPFPPVDYCAQNPCIDSECTCVNQLYNKACICPIVPTDIVEPPPIVQTGCTPNPCENGASCQPQWINDFFCFCPPGFTGKRCETPVCDVYPCLNGGTCQVNEVGFECLCTACYTGSCCNETIPGCNNICPACSVADGAGNCVLDAANCDCNECTDPSAPVCVPGVNGQPRTCEPCSDPCTRFNSATGACDIEIQNTCACAQCPSGQLCTDNPDPSGVVSCNCPACTTWNPLSSTCVGDIHDCGCNPCPSSTDTCVSTAAVPVQSREQRICCPGCTTYVPALGQCIPDDSNCGTNEVCGDVGQCGCGVCFDVDPITNQCTRPITGSCACNPCASGFICTSSADDFGEVTCKSSATAGIKFTLMYLRNANLARALNPPLELYVAPAGSYSSFVTVDAPANTCWDGMDATIPEGQVERIEIPNACMPRNSGVGTYAITVTEQNNQSVIAYGLNKERFSADAFLCLPDVAAGQNYRVVNWHPLSSTSIAPEFGFVALEDNTVVQVLLPPGATPPAGEGSSFTVNLNRLETYLLQDAQRAGAGDYTGTAIRSNKPIHVYCGNVRVAVDSSFSSRDHLVEQIPSIEKWGVQFVVVPLDRNDPTIGIFVREYVRIVRAYTNVQVDCTISRLQDGQLNATTLVFPAGPGVYVQEFDFVSESTPVFISCNSPVMVAHFTQSQTNAIPNNAANNEVFHDPAMAYVAPYDTLQLAQEFFFNTPLYTGGDLAVPHQYNYTVLLIVAEASVFSGVRVSTQGAAPEFVPFLALPGADVGVWTPVPGAPNLFAIKQRVAFGQLKVDHVNGLEFVCMIYASADRESYFMPMGMGLTDLNPPTTPEQLGM